ncbi:MAG: hypothetical protein ABMB14_13350, partial [Myxococcota bacterium]
WMRARGPLRVRLGARVVARTPPAPWAIDRRDGDRVWVRDRIGLGPWVPDGPVTVPALAAPAGRGDGLLARIVPTDAGWVAVGAIALPTVPAAVPRWVRLRALWLRATGTAVRTTADVLRHAGHHVARRALECAR